MRHWLSFVAFVCLLILPLQIFAQNDEIPRFEEADCVTAVPPEASVRCGYLVVPESRLPDADPAWTIRLPVAVIASPNADPAPDPFIYPTSGGPGGSTLISLYGWATATWILPNRDVILIEQRGTEYAQPNLNCREMDAAELENFGLLLTIDEEIALIAEAAQTCRKRLLSEGINLAAYNSAESAADLADLRRVLGYDEWNLYGISYGARLAMTVMRDHPEGLRSVILDSPYTLSMNRYEEIPPSFAQSLDRLFAACAADAGCAAAYPDLEANFYRVVDRWNAAPVTATIQNPYTGEPIELRLTGYDLVSGVFDALYQPDLITILPFVIDQLARGNDDPALPLARNALGVLNLNATGMTYSVECQEEMPFNDPAAVQAAYAAHPVLQFFTNFLAYPVVCDVWEVPPSDAVENERVNSDIPALILAGEFDPIHPDYWGEFADETLPSSYYYEFPGLGHGQIVWHSCPSAMAEAFVNNPTTAPDSACISDMSSPDFLLPADIIVTPAAYRLNGDVIEGGNPLITALLVFCIVAFVAQLVAAAVLWLRGRRVSEGRWAHILAVVVALLNLIFIVLLVVVLFNTDMLTLAFGLPASAAPLLFIPMITAVMAVGLVIGLLLAWGRGYWSAPRRVFYSLVTVAAAAFSVWLLMSDLLPVRL